MENEIKIGQSYTSRTIVTKENCALTVGSGDLEVLATPSMISLMENAAMNAVSPYLKDGETTVGTFIETTHEHPTRLGKEVSATATLTQVDKRKLTFKVEANDENGCIGKGTHTRYIVSIERFMK